MLNSWSSAIAVAMRGVEQTHASTITVATRGAFQDPQRKGEFLRLIGKN
jgi:GTP cyclohydrolase I